MMKKIRNLVLHDVHNTNMARPGISLKKSLLETETENHEGFQISSSIIVDDGHHLHLGNPKVLLLIMKQLITTDLLQARLVNLRWNVVACEVLREKLGFQRIPPSQIKRFTKLMKKNVINPIDSYAIRVDHLMELNTNQFFTRFATDIVNFRVRLSIKEFPRFSTILQTLGNLKQLHVIIFDDNLSTGGYHFIEKNDLENGRGNVWNMGLYSFPHLGTVTFENSDPSYNINSYYDKTLINIINASVNLETIRLIYWNTPLGKVFVKLGIHSPGVVDSYGKSASAQDLIHLFFNTNLKFHLLRIEVSSTVSFELVSDIIHKSGDYLKSLSVVNENIFEKFVISSTLHNLTRLRLNAWNGPVDFAYIGKQFPVLNYLSLNLTNLYELEKSPDATIAPCDSIRTLLLTRLEIGIESNLMKKLTEIFPSVNELFVEVKDQDVLPVIYQFYPNLSVLCLEFNGGGLSLDSITNQCFTGVPDELVKVVRLKDCGCPIVEFPEESRSCWNIGCLKQLTTLILRLPNSVNNVALLEGISRLDKLKTIGLLPFYYHDQEPTKWCLRLIADNFCKLKTLITSTEVVYSENDLDYLFRKFPRLVHKQKL